MSLLALALSILATFGSKNAQTHMPRFITASWAELIAYGVLSAVGCITLFILDSYRGWKQHYKLVARRLLIQLGGEDLPTPDWLKQHPHKPIKVRSVPVWGVPSPDNSLTYFIGLATALVVAIFNYTLWSLVSLFGLRLGLVEASAFAFVLFVVYSRLRVKRRNERERAEIEEHSLFPTF